MAAAEIQVVNPANLAKIESFLNDPGYKEIIENSSTFNSRLCAERRMRMPFIDTQTGVAQSYCNLFMSRKQRMPGQREGQIYSYPSQRWRKTRRQYLSMSTNRWGWNVPVDAPETVGEGENSSGVPGEALCAEDSRDGSQTATVKDDPKEWFYDELAIDEMETGEEPDPESDEDYYDDTYANRRKRRGGSTPAGPGSRGGRVRKSQPDDTPVKRGRAGRGRKRAGQALPYEVPGDADKPFGCELCGAKYKTRPGLTYHYTHTHKESAGGSDGDSRDSRGVTPTPPAPAPPGAALPAAVPGAPPGAPPGAASAAPPGAPPGPPGAPGTEYQDSYLTFLNKPAPSTASGAAAAGAAAAPGAPAAAPAPAPRRPTPPPRPASADTSSSDSAAAPAAHPAAPAADGKEGGRKSKQASPSPYCDFCLGDDRENKKTGAAEELVSCSDCGRSGHPTCLQFTANMTVSVRKYRWQCIECKCCSFCGTSDNDDQLLFCDDCDRGYHMYCLAPPLPAPPEGTWSCKLCLEEFHK